MATALDVIGDRWALLVVRELLPGPRRFTDLAAGLPGIGTNTLTTRLKELEASAIISRRWLPPPAAATVYELTPLGRGLEPILLGLARWGAPLIGTQPVEHPIRAGWLAVAMCAFFRPAGAPEGSFELAMPTGTLTLVVRDGAISARDGEDPQARASVRAEEAVLLPILRGQQGIEAAMAAGTLELRGERDAFAALVTACRIGR